jgi:hypothetical protein
MRSLIADPRSPCQINPLAAVLESIAADRRRRAAAAPAIEAASLGEADIAIQSNAPPAEVPDNGRRRINSG